MQTVLKVKNFRYSNPEVLMLEQSMFSKLVGYYMTAFCTNFTILTLQVFLVLLDLVKQFLLLQYVLRAANKFAPKAQLPKLLHKPQFLMQLSFDVNQKSLGQTGANQSHFC